jgi:DNA-binding NarL/FixJ family response regulator
MESPSMSSPPAAELPGRHVLVVEDEALVAMLLEDMLGDLGCRVIGPVMRVAEALERIAAETAIDVALLDVNLAGERSGRRSPSSSAPATRAASTRLGAIGRC